MTPGRKEKTTPVSIRLSADERSRLESEAGKRSLSEYKRSTVLRLREGGPDPIALRSDEVLFVRLGSVAGPDLTTLVLERVVAMTPSTGKRIVVPNECD